MLSARSISIPPHHVLVTSDETSAEWWAEVSALGWRRTDHVAERTEERYGKWYVPLVDAVAQSLAIGFVGTDGSTMSLVAKRRVEDWSGGVGELVSGVVCETGFGAQAELIGTNWMEGRG
jgi:hypothetical protein